MSINVKSKEPKMRTKAKRDGEKKKRGQKRQIWRKRSKEKMKGK